MDATAEILPVLEDIFASMIPLLIAVIRP